MYKLPQNIYLFITFMFVLLVIGVDGQKWHSVKTLTTDHGLANDHIHNITQDQDGFLWIATYDGLSRYDGNDFRNYYHKPGDTNSFPHFNTNEVLIDHHNTVWVFCQKHIPVVYDRVKDRFKRFMSGDARFEHPHDMTVGNNGEMWFVTDSLIIRLTTDDQLITAFKYNFEGNPTSIDQNFNTQIVVDDSGEIWLIVSSQGGFQFYKTFFYENGKVVLKMTGIINYEDVIPFTYQHFYTNLSISISKKNHVWLFSNFGIFKLDAANHLFVKNPDLPEDEEFRNRKHLMWADEDGNIYQINGQEKQTIFNDADEEHLLSTFYLDNSNILWIGKHDHNGNGIGLFKYLQIPDYFKNYLNEPVLNNNPNMVFPIIKDGKGNLWAGLRYSKELFKVNQDGSYQKSDVFRSLTEPNPKGLKCFLGDSTGFWIATTSEQLVFYDITRDTKTCYRPKIVDERKSHFVIQNLIKSNGKILINGELGIYRFDPKKNEITLLVKHEAEGTGFSFVGDEANGFWVGSYTNTVFHYDSSFTLDGTFRIGNDANTVEHICHGDSNDIWTAFMGGGIGHLYLKSGKTETLSVVDGLSSNITYSILKDKKGKLWISTSNGISYFDPYDRKFKNFGKNEGILITDFNSDSHFQTEEGEMYFGGVGGMISFHPDTIRRHFGSDTAQKILITDFKVSSENRFFEKPLYEMDNFKLNKGDNNFSISFACIDFLHADKIKYRYRLLGKNNQWLNLDHRNKTINYSYLNPGSYLLEIEAAKLNEGWNNKKQISIIIPTRLIDNIWFRLAISFFIITGILFVILLYYRQLKLINKQVQNELRLESLRGQMNPHFIFNSLNSINYFIAKEDKLSANHFIADFSQLIRSILDNMSKDYIQLSDELETIQGYLRLEHMRFGEKFNYKITTSDGIDCEEWSIFPGIIQPFIENAIWHGIRGIENRTGMLTVTFIMINPTKLQCIIQDDGIGRKRSQAQKKGPQHHKSRGIDIVKDRLRIIGNQNKTTYTVIIEDLFPEETDTGTKVIIEIPIKPT